MKKITLKFLMAIALVFSYSGMAQTLNEAAGWPSADWTISGTYTAAGLLSDPTVDATFGFDDDAAGNGSFDDIQATSPIIDLTAASVAGETWISVSGDIIYYELEDVLTIEVYDADAMTWSVVETFDGNTTVVADFQNCAATVAYTSSVINIAGYTATQLSGFQYRFSYDDLDGYEWGFCLSSPTITSETPPACADPIALMVANMTSSSADLSWTESSTATAWDIEIVDVTAAGAQTMTPTETGVTNPYTVMGLTADNDYEYYVRANCGVDGTSNWVGPIAFSTTVSCPDPSTLTATGITTTSADLGWTAVGGTTLWDIEIVDVTAAGAQTMTPTETGVTNPYTIMGLTDSNDYEYYVRADCGGGDVSAWAGPFAFTTECNSFTAPYSEDFENAGAIPNCWSSASSTSKDWSFATVPTFGNAYSDHTTGAGYFAFVDASTATVTADATLTSPSVDVSGLTTPALDFYVYHFVAGGVNSNTLTVEVWDGAAWNVVYTDNTGDIDEWEHVIIDLSTLTITGDIIARFIQDTASNPNYENDIAIDDVSFVEAPSCFDPSSLTVANVSSDSAELGWTENGSATSWNIEIVDITTAGTPTGTPTATGVTNPYMATGLTPDNDYEFYVQADCGASGVSAWIGPLAFTTTVLCPEPTALNAANITADSADLEWTIGSTEVLWDVELVDITAAGTVTGTPTATGVSNPYMATGLASNNEYEFYVRADCGANGASIWVGPFAFTTACTAIVPDYTADMSVNVPDTCWEEASNGEVATGPTDLGSSSWKTDAFGPDDNFYGAGIYSNRINIYGTFAIRDWLISPVFDLSSGGPYQLEMNVAVTNYNDGDTADAMGDDDEVQLLVTTDGGVTWVNLTTWNTGNEPVLTGTEFVQDLTTYSGDTQFAIWASNGTVGSTDYDFHVGKFKVREIPSCLEPTNVMSTISDMTADFTWGMGDSETTWEYANLTSPSTEPTTGTSTTDMMASITGLTPETAYDFYVRSDCGGDYSSWVVVSYTTPPTPPSNDDCSGATALTPGGVFADNAIDGTVFGASADAEAASCGTDGAGVWYSIVVPASGDVTIQVGDDSSGGTGFDSVIEAFTGTCGSFNSIGCDDDGVPGFGDGYSQLELTGLTGGETIYVRVWEYGGDEIEPFSISAYSASLSVGDVENEAAFTYYPNPVKNTLTLNAQNTIEQVTMYNMLGQEVLRVTPNTVDSDINMSSLQTGAYFVKVTIGNVTETIRVIKQ
ncbi:putative secreted protein (Por secretion system target) [Winogradskyella eximia]|uniref:Putative secreted protein (Por secretion system target) n=1 Tax=Winogradskyella eximia TaxID=262006 RepID=A0A3D9GQ28_9FLAO|nr:fibronectin type III domain-containing protein [Winogradskyella eximia]RED38541.1 putative secreted protein (Por secretion system target) [Winogradskyella eximia]